MIFTDRSSENPYDPPLEKQVSRQRQPEAWPLTASFLLTNVVGCGFLASYWWDQGIVQVLARSALFVVIIAAVHVGGYLLYRWQGGQPVVLPRVIWRMAFLFAAVQQLAILLFSLLLLDGGRLFRCALVAVIAYWIVVVLRVVRRRVRQTNLEWYLAMFGTWPLLLVTAVIAKSLGRF